MDLIQDQSIGVFVYYDDGVGRERLEALEEQLLKSSYPSSEELKAIKAELKALQPYTITLRDNHELLKATRSYLSGQILILQEHYYNQTFGLTKKQTALSCRRRYSCLPSRLDSNFNIIAIHIDQNTYDNSMCIV